MKHEFKTPEMRHRAEWAATLAMVFEHAHPAEAVPLAVAYAESFETGGPRLGDPFGMVASDAGIWARSAPPHELIAYTLAGLEQMPKAHLSNPARKKLFKHLWKDFTDRDRTAFLRHVTGAA